MGVYGVLVVFSTLILVIATFISHTVAALIFLPLVFDVGSAMDQPHPNLLVMGGVLMCSAAMGLPTSGFPNMSTFYSSHSLSNQLTYLHSRHYEGGCRRAEIPTSQALHQPWCPKQSADLGCCGDSGLRYYGGCRSGLIAAYTKAMQMQLLHILQSRQIFFLFVIH